jgi:hypothetical protein
MSPPSEVEAEGGSEKPASLRVWLISGVTPRQQQGLLERPIQFFHTLSAASLPEWVKDSVNRPAGEPARKTMSAIAMGAPFC